MRNIIAVPLIIILLTGCAFAKSLEYLGDKETFHQYEGNCFLIADKINERLIVQKCPLRSAIEVVGTVVTLGLANPAQFSNQRYDNAIEDYLKQTYSDKKCNFKTSLIYEDGLYEYTYSCN